MNGTQLCRLLAEEAGLTAKISQNGWVRISDSNSRHGVYITAIDTMVSYKDYRDDRFVDENIDLKNPGSIGELKAFFAKVKSAILYELDKQTQEWAAE